MNPGYIYILQNPSLEETHLKIGRTTRDPEERAAEISSSTGVPTPFEVAWWSESVDCHRAESILHHHLTPYRTSTAREFFEIDLDEAIDFAKGAIRKSGGRTGGLPYLLRRLTHWTFHGIVRPILRLPVQLILEADRERIFDRFERGRCANDASESGVGLGLSLVKEIVAAHGGSVTARATDAGLTAMTVSLPM